MKTVKQNTRLKKPVLAATALLVIAAAACGIYLSDFYHAEIPAAEAFAPASTIETHTDSEGNLVFAPKHANTGLVFYPGGKVEHLAYAPLMQAFAERGILCVLVEMPFHLAVFDSNAAEGLPQQYPDIESWYIGGHSLGGSMAAAYLETCPEAFEGLLLLGAYSTADLSQTDLRVLSVYGSEDLVMNRENYEQNKVNLPEDFEQTILEGGCHAFFGMYGAQEGDGTPTISNEEQITLTADAFAAMVQRP